MNSNHSAVQNTQSLPLRRQIWYGVGYLPDSLLNNAYGILIFIVYDGELKLGAAAIGLVGLIIRFWDAINDPFIGNLSDRTRSRWGRRHPYMIAGVVTGALCTLLVWNPPTGMGEAGLWWYLLITAFLYYTAFSLYSVPYFALGLGMSTSERDRDGIMGWRVAANSVVLCLLPLAPMLIHNGLLGATPMESLSRLSLILAGLMVASGFVAARLLPEPPIIEAGSGRGPGLFDGLKCVYRNGPFLITTGIVSLALVGLVASSAMLYYMNLAFVYPLGELAVRKAAATRLMAVTGFTGAFVGLCVSPFVAAMAVRFGRKSLLSAAMGLMAVAYLLSPWLFRADEPYLQLVFHVLFFFGLTCVWVLTAAMIGEVCDLDEVKTGLRREGIFSAMFNFGAKLSLAFSMFVGGALVSASGFSFELPEQAAWTLLWLKVFFAVLPALCFMAGIYLIRIYPLSAEFIEQFRAQAILKKHVSA
jgi:GPH family glycoside/pentoside/hexuronide:cation symporter